jgi:hypothetical protein
MKFELSRESKRQSTINFNFDVKRVLCLWKRQSYRSLLQGLLKTTGKIKLKVPKDAHLGSFGDYLDKVEENNGMEFQRGNISDFEIQKVFKKVAFISVIKAVIGPVIESCILIDRYLAWMEKGYTTKLVNLFDYDKSPRNMAIIVSKELL